MRLDRDRVAPGVQHLVVEDQGEHERVRRHPAQRPVVAAAALAEPVSLGVDRQAGRDHHVGLADPLHPDPRPGRFVAADPAAAGLSGAVVLGPVQVQIRQHHR